MFGFKLKALCLLAALVGTLDAFAVTRDIRFLYRPDPAVPASNTFVRLNPVTCGNAVTCRTNEHALVLGTSIAAPISAGMASRHTPMFRTATDWRPMQLRNNSTGSSLPANVRIVAVSGIFNFRPDLTRLVPEATSVALAYTMLFGGYTIRDGWLSPPAPCRAWQYGGLGNNAAMHFAIRTADTACMRPVIADISSLWVSSAKVIVEIQLPRPQVAQAGLYSGIQRFSVGPGMDIDFGDAVLFADPELAINLELEVDPIFKVEFPGGSNLLSLEPEGGWLNWLNRGRKPTRLWREQSFNFSTSIPFKMSMRCEHTEGNHCAIAASDGHQVPVEIRMTLPEGMRDTGGRPVNGYLLNRHDTPQFNPQRIILGRPGKLQFEVPRPDMEAMLNHPGKAYSGAVTFIWDAQI